MLLLFLFFVARPDGKVEVHFSWPLLRADEVRGVTVNA
jgi:hypothetical protein